MMRLRSPLLISLATLLAGTLVACGPAAPPSAGSTSPATPAAALPAAAQGAAAETPPDLAAREADLARRESELAAREAASKAPAVGVAAPAKHHARPVRTAPGPAPEATDLARVTPAEAAERPSPPLTLAAGMTIPVSLTQALTSQTAQIGDPVDARVTRAVLVDGRTALPAGTRLRGTVSAVVSGSRKIGGTPQIALHFDGIDLVPGKTASLNGSLSQQGRSDTGRDAAKIAGGALLGAIIGKQVGDNKGRLIGGLLGAGAGAAVAEKTGTEVVLGEGSEMDVTLESPLTVYVN